MSITANNLLRRGAERPVLMGILNVTPDSFSDGGMWNSPELARAHALDMIADGAGIIDIGGESTRPGADPVSESDELARILPAIRSIREVSDCILSIDTMKASVARAAVEAGADIINDVSGLADPLMAKTAAELDVPLVLMNNYGTPKTFNTDFIEGDILEVAGIYLKNCLEKAMDSGVKEKNIILDPGIGFGTTHDQSIRILENSSYFGFGKYPVLIGPSRKRFLAQFRPGMDRDEATAEACVVAAVNGADILRVHNVACTAKKF